MRDTELKERTPDVAAEDVTLEGDANSIYEEDGALQVGFLDQLREDIANSDVAAVQLTIANLHESELGDILEELERHERTQLVLLGGEAFDYSALTEVDESIRLEILDHVPNEEIAGAFQELESDDAVYLLEDLEQVDQEEILEQIPFQERIRLRRALEYPEETAGRRMQTEFIAVPPFWTVGQTIDYMREDQDLPERFSEIFAIDPTFKLSGVVALDGLLRSARERSIEEVMDENVRAVSDQADQEDAAMLFEQYDLLTAPVVDENRRLVGVLTIDDVVDVIHQEADEDIKRLGGVGDEEFSDRVFEITRSRFAWLLINLATSILASLVIGLFDATIQEMVALAILMPIVASMGGNAGTQTMTVTVRALATKDLRASNAWRVIRREFTVGAINGLLFALIMGVVTYFWFGSNSLGLIIGTAMIVNMIAAGLAGILIPMGLDRIDVDPAVASSVFVTTITDVIGFFAFLGLAAWWIGFT
jgi:magnesium transporter